jgi:hypothetical protein
VTPDFEELVGRDLDPEERARLLHAHELLIAAGAPPELPPSLAAPSRRQVETPTTPFFNRRRNAAVALLAAALAVAAFGIGYLTGQHGGGFAEKRTVVMHSAPGAPAGAIGSIALGHRDDAGNWQMLVRVSNLDKLSRGAYYTVWLTRNGHAVAPCGSFLVGSAPTTEVRFTVAYKLKNFDGWVVTVQKPKHHEPGHVVLTTV